MSKSSLLTIRDDNIIRNQEYLKKLGIFTSQDNDNSITKYKNRIPKRIVYSFTDIHEIYDIFPCREREIQIISEFLQSKVMNPKLPLLINGVSGTGKSDICTKVLAKIVPNSHIIIDCSHFKVLKHLLQVIWSSVLLNNSFRLKKSTPSIHEFQRLRMLSVDDLRTGISALFRTLGLQLDESVLNHPFVIFFDDIDKVEGISVGLASHLLKLVDEDFLSFKTMATSTVMSFSNSIVVTFPLYSESQLRKIFISKATMSPQLLRIHTMSEVNSVNLDHLKTTDYDVKLQDQFNIELFTDLIASSLSTIMLRTNHIGFIWSILIKVWEESHDSVDLLGEASTTSIAVKHKFSIQKATNAVDNFRVSSLWHFSGLNDSRSNDSVNSVFELPLSSRILLIAGYVCKHTGSKHFDSRSIAGSTRGRIKRSRKMINTDDTTAIEYGYEAHNYSFSLERLFYIVRIVAETVESSSNSAKESSDINVFSQLIESASLLSQVSLLVAQGFFSKLKSDIDNPVYTCSVPQDMAEDLAKYFSDFKLHFLIDSL